MLFAAAIGNVAFRVLKVAAPAGVGVFLADGNLPLPQRQAHDELLGHHASVRPALGVHVAVFVLGTQFLLLGAAPVLIVGVVGIEVDGERSQLARIIEVGLVLGRILVAARATVVQVVVWGAVGSQVIGIVVGRLHVVVDVLIETAEGVAVVQLVVEAHAPFGIGIAH